MFTQTQFQSTLSLRRATSVFVYFVTTAVNFNPRSPCGERPMASWTLVDVRPISIHALLAESDIAHYLNRGHSLEISIHALLAESDSKYHQIGPIVSV